MNFKLKIWRQENAKAKGKFVDYNITDISPDSSFLEMLDQLNEKIINEGIDSPVAYEKGDCGVIFDHDCREGICGMCGMVINGRAHGPDLGITTCQLHMRKFNDGDTIIIEPYRAKGFPVIKDLIVDKSALDKIIQAGGFVSVNTGGVPDANAIPIPKEKYELAMDAASCIGCGACVATCPNSSAMLFVAAKVSQLALLPQGKHERNARARNMIAKMDELGFGNCTNIGACSVECPKEIDLTNIARLNREYIAANLKR